MPKTAALSRLDLNAALPASLAALLPAERSELQAQIVAGMQTAAASRDFGALTRLTQAATSYEALGHAWDDAAWGALVSTLLALLQSDVTVSLPRRVVLLRLLAALLATPRDASLLATPPDWRVWWYAVQAALVPAVKATAASTVEASHSQALLRVVRRLAVYWGNEADTLTQLVRVASPSLVPADSRDARAVQQLTIFFPPSLTEAALPPGTLDLFWRHWQATDGVPGVDALWAQIFLRLRPFNLSGSAFDWVGFVPFLHRRLWRCLNPAIHGAPAGLRGISSEPPLMPHSFYESNSQYAAVSALAKLLIELLEVVPGSAPSTLETLEAMLRAVSPFLHPSQDAVCHWYLTFVRDVVVAVAKRAQREAGVAAADALALAPRVAPQEWETRAWAAAAPGAGPAPFACVWAAYAAEAGLPCAQPTPLSQASLLRLLDALLPPLFGAFYLSGRNNDYGLECVEKALDAAYSLAPARIASELARFAVPALGEGAVDTVHLARNALQMLGSLGVSTLGPLPRLAGVLPALLRSVLPAIDPNDADKTCEMLATFTAWLCQMPLVDPSEGSFVSLGQDDDATPHLPAGHAALPGQARPGARAFLLGPGDTILSAGLVVDPEPAPLLSSGPPPSHPAEAAALQEALAAANELVQDASGYTAPAFGAWETLRPSAWLPTPTPSRAAIAAAAAAGIACGGSGGGGGDEAAASVTAAATARLEPAASRLFASASAAYTELSEWCFAALDRLLTLLAARPESGKGRDGRSRAPDEVTGRIYQFTNALFGSASPALHAKLLTRVSTWLRSTSILDDAEIVKSFLSAVGRTRGGAAGAALLAGQLEAVAADPSMSAPLRVWHAQMVAALVAPNGTGAVLPPHMAGITALVASCCAPGVTAPERKAGISIVKALLPVLLTPAAALTSPPVVGHLASHPWTHWGEGYIPAARGVPPPVGGPGGGLDPVWYVPGPAEAAAAAAFVNATAGAAMGRIEAWLQAHGTAGATRPPAALEALRNDLQVVRAVATGAGQALADTTSPAGSEEVLPVGCSGLTLVWVPAQQGGGAGAIRLATELPTLPSEAATAAVPARHRMAELVAAFGPLLASDANLKTDAVLTKRLVKAAAALCIRRGPPLSHAKAGLRSLSDSVQDAYASADARVTRAFLKRAAQAWGTGVSPAEPHPALRRPTGLPLPAAAAPSSPDACAALAAAAAATPRAPLLDYPTLACLYGAHYTHRAAMLVAVMPRALHWGAGSLATVLAASMAGGGGLSTGDGEEGEDGSEIVAEAEAAEAEEGGGGAETGGEGEADAAASAAAATAAAGVLMADAEEAAANVTPTPESADAAAAAAAELVADPTGVSGVDVSMLPAGEGLPGSPTVARVAYTTLAKQPERKLAWRAVDPSSATPWLGVRAVRRLAPAEFPYALLISLLAQLLRSPFALVNRQTGLEVLSVATLFPWLRRPLCTTALDRLAGLQAALGGGAGFGPPPAPLPASASSPPAASSPSVKPVVESEDVLADLGLALLQPTAVYHDWCLFERTLSVLLGANVLVEAVRLDRQLTLTQMLLRSVLALLGSYHPRPLDPASVPGDARWRAFRRDLAAKVVGAMYPASPTSSSSNAALPAVLCADGVRRPSAAPLPPSSAPHWLYECLALHAAASCLETVPAPLPPLLIHEPVDVAATLPPAVKKLLALPSTEAAAAAASPAGDATETLFLWALSACISHDEALRRVAHTTLHFLLHNRSMLLALRPEAVPPLPRVAAALDHPLFVSQLVTALLPPPSDDGRSLRGGVAFIAALAVGGVETPLRGGGDRPAFRSGRMALYRALVTCWPHAAPALLEAGRELIVSVVASGRAGAAPGAGGGDDAAAGAGTGTPAVLPPVTSPLPGKDGEGHELTTVRARAIGGLEIASALLWLAVDGRPIGPAPTAAELLPSVLASSSSPLPLGTVVFDPTTDADPALLAAAAGLGEAAPAQSSAAPAFLLAPAASSGKPTAGDFASPDLLMLAVIKKVLHPLLGVAGAGAGGGIAAAPDDVTTAVSRAINGAHIVQYPLLARWVYASTCVALGGATGSALPPAGAPGPWGGAEAGALPPALAAMRALLATQVLPPEAAGLSRAATEALLPFPAARASGGSAAAPTALPAASASAGFTAVGQLIRLAVTVIAESASHRGMRLAETCVPRRRRWERVHAFADYYLPPPGSEGGLRPAVDAGLAAARQLLPCLLGAVAHPFRRVRQEVASALCQLLKTDPALADTGVPPAYAACAAMALPDPWTTGASALSSGGAAYAPLSVQAYRLFGYPDPPAPHSSSKGVVQPSASVTAPAPWVSAALAVLTAYAQPIVPVLSKSLPGASLSSSSSPTGEGGAGAVTDDVTRWAENALETLATLATYTVQPGHHDAGLIALLLGPLLLAAHPAAAADVGALLRKASRALSNDVLVAPHGPAAAFLARGYADVRATLTEALLASVALPTAGPWGAPAAAAPASAKGGQTPGEASGDATAPVAADTVALPLSGLEGDGGEGWLLRGLLMLLSRVARFGLKAGSSGGDEEGEAGEPAPAPAASAAATTPAQPPTAGAASMTYMTATRSAALTALSGLATRNLPGLDPTDWAAVTSSLHAGLRDPYPEVQAKAAAAASLALMVRPLAIQLAWGAKHAKLLRTKVPRRVEPPASLATASPEEVATHREYRRALAKATNRRLTGTYGIAAVLHVHPYSVPPGLPSLLCALASRASDAALRGTVQGVVADFRRSHADGWEAHHKAAFTPSQINDLDGVSSSASMFT